MKQLMITGMAALLFAGCSSDDAGTENNNGLAADTVEHELDNSGFYSICWYNVENLMDTIDNPATADDEFTPQSEKMWNTERYNTKLAHLSEVLSKLMGEEGLLPEVIALGEVENRAVVKDLVSTPAFDGKDYGIVHRDSPDGRGIDVAVAYDKTKFEVLQENFYTILVPDTDRPNTRLLLYVKGVVAKKDTLHFFVNHWPSRYGGQEASEPKRVAVAKVVREKVDSILDASGEDEKILLMGDFNDYPDNKSLTEVLRAGKNPDGDPRQLYNLSISLSEDGQGTYNYKGEWGCLDQIIVSHALHTAEAGMCELNNTAAIYREDYIMYHDKKYDDWKPSRTYGGPNYYGGYSDHLPIVATFDIR